ncbi:MAG TPA: hypothetical protein VIK69_11970 [Methylophilaceae bacterium]
MSEITQEMIDAAHPLKTGEHDLFKEAMGLVGKRRGKMDLVKLVNFLLYERKRLEHEVRLLGSVKELANALGAYLNEKEPHP